MSARVVVTGGTGFVGAPLSHELVRRGFEVVAVSRSIPEKDLHTEEEPKIVRLDLFGSSTTELSKLFEDFPADILIHTAWYTNPDDYLSSEDANLACLDGSLTLVRAAIRAGCPRIVGIGTGIELSVAHLPITEDSAPDPRTIYAAAKVSLYHLTARLCAAAGVSFAWARLFNLYGPGENPRRVIPQVTRALLAGKPIEVSKGEQVRDFLYVDDAVRGIAAVASGSIEGPVNVCSSNPVELRQVFEQIGRAAGAPRLIRYGARPYRAGEDMAVWGSNDLLRSTGWRQRIDLATGIEMTVDWWKRNG